MHSVSVWYVLLRDVLGMRIEISDICDFRMTLNISSGIITQQMRGVFTRHSSVAVPPTTPCPPPPEFMLLPQLTNDKHLWTVAAICWVFQSILSWNWLALYEKCTENCHAYQGKSSHNSAFFLYTCSYEYFFFFWWIHWDVLKNIHIGLHIMQFILILLTVCKQKLKTRCNCA